MLFDIRPKERIVDLFGRENESRELAKGLEEYPIVLVEGVRRVGKSSLCQAVLNSLGFPVLNLDIRELHSQGPSITETAFLNQVERKLGQISGIEKLGGFLKRMKGIKVMGSEVSVDWSEVTFPGLMEKLDAYAKTVGMPAVLYIDEAQYLKNYGSRGGRNLLDAFAWIYDHLEHVRIVLTGSEVGMLHDFISLRDYDMPLFGRIIKEVRVEPFSPAKSLDFLERGFAEMDVTVDFDLKDVVKQIDGIPGYLVQFGRQYMDRRNVEDALDEVYSVLSGMVERDLRELARRSDRYVKTLRYIANGATGWTMIQNLFRGDGDDIGKSTLSNTLSVLEKMTWIHRIPRRNRPGHDFEIVDPVLAEALKRHLR